MAKPLKRKHEETNKKALESNKVPESAVEQDKVKHGTTDTEQNLVTASKDDAPISVEEALKAAEEFDSSDEEDVRNTVGNIPMEWYKEYDHIGYDLLGEKILKPPTGDEIDEFLEKNDNPDYWRSVMDRSTGQKVILSDQDVALVRSLVRGKYVDPNYDPYEPWVDFFSCETMIHAVTNQPEHKRSFIPSKLEAKKVGRLVHAMKMGWIKPRAPKKLDDQPQFYDLWGGQKELEISKRIQHYIPAPRRALPGHAESYNPPPEYLFNKEEEERWQNADPERRRLDFMPKRYTSLRQVPGYSEFINEQFQRCLDLYICPRQRKKRMDVPDPAMLLPEVKPRKELRPYPETLALIYKGHTAAVRCISVEPLGRYMASGSQDCTVRLWEVVTGRCVQTLKFDSPVKDIAWSPNPERHVVAVAVGNEIIIVNPPKYGDSVVIKKTDELINSFEQSEPDTSIANQVSVDWQCITNSDQHKEGQRLRIVHHKVVNQVIWHRQGDYFAAVLHSEDNKAVIIHQLSKRRSQRPFTALKDVQCVQFHPTLPHFFVATKIGIRKYNLLKQELVKKLFSNVKWVSSMAVHPRGDHLIIGSYDRALNWFDLDLSNKPYKQFKRVHRQAIRQVAFHRTYPLFASASADGDVFIYHGQVYDDLLKNPHIQGVKKLSGCHKSTQETDIGVLDCEFHPTQPWIFTCGVDSTIKLYS